LGTRYYIGKTQARVEKHARQEVKKRLETLRELPAYKMIFKKKLDKKWGLTINFVKVMSQKEIVQLKAPGHGEYDPGDYEFSDPGEYDPGDYEFG